MRRCSILLTIIAAVATTPTAPAQHLDVAFNPNGEIQFASAARMDALEAELRDLRLMLEQTQTRNISLDQIESCCVRPPGLFVSADFLYLKPHRSGMDFAISDPNTDNNIEGPIEALELASDSGFRASIGYVTGSGWDIAFTYSFFESEDSRNVTEPPGGRLWLTHTNPASNNNHADTAVALADLSYDVFDLESGYWFYPTCVTALRIFGGIRGATITDEMTVTYAGGTLLTPRVQTHRSQVDGVGIRSGAEGHWAVLDNLTLFSRVAGAVVLGDVSIRYTEVQSAFLGQGDVDVSYEYFEALPVIEAATGISWRRNNLAVQVGYEATAWLNLDQRINFTGAETINRGNLTGVPNDLVLGGLFARLTYNR